MGGPASPRARFFLSVIFRRWKKRQIVLMPVATLRSASSASVMSGVFS